MSPVYVYTFSNNVPQPHPLSTLTQARAFLLRECETFQSVEIQIGANRQVIFCGEAHSVIREIEQRYFLAH